MNSLEQSIRKDIEVISNNLSVMLSTGGNSETIAALLRQIEDLNGQLEFVTNDRCERDECCYEYEQSEYNDLPNPPDLVRCGKTCGGCDHNRKHNCEEVCVCE